MQSGTTFAWIIQPLWHHYDTIWKWCHPVLYSHWLVIIDYPKQVHTCKRYICWSNMIDSPSDSPFATSPLCSTLATVQLIIIDLLHFLFIVLEVLVIVLTLCVFALLHVIRCLQNSPCEPLWLATRSSKSINHKDLEHYNNVPPQRGVLVWCVQCIQGRDRMRLIRHSVWWWEDRLYFMEQRVNAYYMVMTHVSK